MDTQPGSHYNRNIPMVIMDNDSAYNNNKTENSTTKKDKSGLDSEASIGLIEQPRKPAEPTQHNNPYASFPGSDLASAPTANEDDNWSDDDEEIDVEDKKTNLIARVIVNIQEWAKAGYAWLMRVTRGYLLSTILFVGYCVYFTAAMMHKFGDEGSIRLLCCTILGLIIMFHRVVTSALWRALNKCSCVSDSTASWKNRMKTVRFFTRWLFYGGLTAIMVWALVEQGMDNPGNLRSLPGLVVFMVVPLLFSTRPGKINWHTVYWSIGLQFLGALLVLRWKIGHEAILWIQARLDEFFHNTRAGSKLLFGDSYEDHYMIFGALPIVFFTNATLTILYYLGVIQFVIKVIGNLLNFILGTSPAESMAVAAGIFMEGVTAILALRPYLRSLSKSQLFLVITSVFSSLGGAYLAILSAIGVSLEFLIPAMVVSAPATFAVCKVMIPETKWKKGCEAEKKVEMDDTERSRYANIVDAAQTGATSMLTLVGNIAVVAFAFFSYIEWINNTLGWFGDRVGVDNLSIELISSYLLYPVAALMGIEANDCRNVAMLLGYRLGINNIIAFFKLTELKVNKAVYHQYLAATNGTGPVSFVHDDIVLDLWNKTLKDGFISSRSEAIITYTLCGFSSFLSVVITIGIMFMLVPNRRAWISKVTIPALIAGNLANCMTGCFASIFY